MSKSVAGVSAGGTPPSGAIVKQDGRTLVDTEHPDYLKLTEIAREGYRHAASFEGIAHAILLEGFSRAGGTPSDSERLTAIAERITQLGGAPDLNPEGMASRSHSEYVAGTTLLDMIKEDLIAERIAIESYTEIVRFLGDKDVTTRRLMEQILAVEEEHANDMHDLLEKVK